MDVVVRGGALLKILRWLLILLILGVSSSAALADGIDPALGVKGGGDDSPWPGIMSFTIANDQNGFFRTPSFFITEGSITNFLASFDTPQPGGFSTLEGSAFIVTGLSDAEALLSGGTIFPFSACPNEIDCANGTQIGNQIFGDFYFATQGAVNGSVVTFTSNSSVPEPASMILMLTGLGAMGLRRLRRNKVPS